MAWLYRTSMHLAIDALRKRRRQNTESASGDAQPSLPCARSLQQLLEARQLIAALCARVPGDELQAAVLCRVDGLGHVEAAEVLAISERTLRRLLARFDQRSERFRQEVLS
jgi:DNA-directed RNA polymerase specialized sigma24 family protein